jgi:hypothetical protein
MIFSVAGPKATGNRLAKKREKRRSRFQSFRVSRFENLVLEAFETCPLSGQGSDEELSGCEVSGFLGLKP